MPKDVADRLKARGRLEGQGSKPMIIELGHYALVLALATAIVVSIMPVIGARRGDLAMMDIGTDRRSRHVRAGRLLLRRSDLCPCRLRFLGR